MFLHVSIWSFEVIPIMLKIINNNMLLHCFTWEPFVSSVNDLNNVLDEIFIIWRFMPNLKGKCTCQRVLQVGKQSVRQFCHPTSPSIMNTTALLFNQNYHTLIIKREITSQKPVEKKAHNFSHKEQWKKIQTDRKYSTTQ